MSEGHPTKPAKPSKPYPDFPLTAHPAGYWCKKIRGKLYYFGPWDDPDGALAKYREQAEALHSGRIPRPDPEAVTVKDACNAFLNAKQTAVANGELSALTFKYYREAAEHLLKHVGKGRLLVDLTPQDFAGLRDKLAKRYGPHRLSLLVRCVRVILKYAFDSGLTDRPTRTGAGFRGASKKTLRLHRAARGPKLFSADEIRRMIAAGNIAQRVAVLLGINCALGNADIARLPLPALDLEGGWMDYPRVKTGLPRRCALWPETVAALRKALSRRRGPIDPDGPALVARNAGREEAYGGRTVARQVNKLLKKLGIGGRTFYGLRHTHRTVSDGAKDQPASDLIMGHEVPHMSSIYRETISDERLKAVADHVRTWLFSSAGNDPAVK
jgi:integrase